MADGADGDVVREPPVASDVRTLADLPFHVSGRFPKSVLIRRCREGGVDDLSSREFFDQIRDLSLGLTALGVERGDRVALVSDSRPEWTVADLAILTAGGVTVPVYPTLSASQVQFILKDSGARVAIVADEDQAAKVRACRSQLPDLRVVVVIDRHDAGTGDWDTSDEWPLSVVARRGHTRLMREDGLGRRYRQTCADIEPGRVATILYTSGTTGDPKGVMLTHANILSNVMATAHVITMTPEDEALSFLPLSHSFERTVLYTYLYTGVTVAFAESLETIGRDLQTVRPTIVTGVPRVFEKLHVRILAAVAEAPRVRQWIFRWAVAVGRARATATLARQPVPWAVALQDRLADRLVFATIRGRTGGRLRYFLSGSAPLSRAVAEFFFAIGLPIIEGYGLTETSPVLTINPPDAPRIGTVGRPLPGVTIRIAEDGEILARGPNIMAGYYQQPEATRAAIRDEWFHTGDVGQMDADHYLTITDRKKDLIITSGGKNIAPQPIEALLRRSELVTEAVLIGDRRRFISALIVPNRAALEAHLRASSSPLEPPEQLVAREDVHVVYQGLVDAANTNLAPFEQVKRFALLPHEFTIAGGELTPTMKVKRRVIEERWNGVIEELYRQD